ncbi:hypothetical protein [Kutzneria buriramensis]|uniref:Uncharacterized protein n=1 Tax=Kutzneria buriramensis TaxID=1045776 RepID=A0A3E0GSL8_9PSEU|nr:hypothetical protein [Kutzneria buriramensis]REH25997.1 hypothetical protein BCF44_13536 [Kutzneria buriramensis]
MTTTTATPSLVEQMLEQARLLLNKRFMAASDITIAEVYLDAAEVARQYPGGRDDVLAAAAELRKAEDRPHTGDQERHITAARLRLRIAAASHQPADDVVLPAPKPTRRRFNGDAAH